MTPREERDSRERAAHARARATSSIAVVCAAENRNARCERIRELIRRRRRGAPARKLPGRMVFTRRIDRSQPRDAERPPRVIYGDRCGVGRVDTQQDVRSSAGLYRKNN